MNGSTVRPKAHGQDLRIPDSVFDEDDTDKRPGNENGRGTISKVQSPKKRCDSCGKFFKGEKGVNIHMGKMHKDISAGKQKQRSLGTPGRKTRENSSQEAHHRTRDIQATATQLTPSPQSQQLPPEIQEVSRKPKLQYPPATDKRWQELDDDLEASLSVQLKGSPKQKMKQMTVIVFSMCEARFDKKTGDKERKGVAGPSRRQRKISEIRRELRLLKRRWKAVPDDEKEGWSCLRDELRKKLASQR